MKIKILAEATRPVTGWKGLEYKPAFPVLKPPGANLYPPDLNTNFSCFRLVKAHFKHAQDNFSIMEEKQSLVLTCISNH